MHGSLLVKYAQLFRSTHIFCWNVGLYYPMPILFCIYWTVLGISLDFKKEILCIFHVVTFQVPGKFDPQFQSWWPSNMIPGNIYTSMPTTMISNLVFPPTLLHSCLNGLRSCDSLPSLLKCLTLPDHRKVETVSKQ